MEQKPPNSPKTIGLSLSKIINGICAFLAVLVLTDMRSTIKEMQEAQQTIIGQYGDLNTRITVIEYMLKVQKTDGKPQSRLPNNKLDNIVLAKPEKEYEISDHI